MANDKTVLCWDTFCEHKETLPRMETDTWRHGRMVTILVVEGISASGAIDRSHERLSRISIEVVGALVMTFSSRNVITTL